ncbi:RidA family protein [Citrobacter amalonaticus]|uniref:RidA family protein n=1 Tax=Citrobacter amalonaticus TaxID=35703 RepID=A0A2S4S0Z0_CITAM|nr:RidA family protein [Citrobacter amalonaticus]POT55309.1 RidA family protein [Citrobacter amalonaticus]POT77084.1 RidA family protein [Citrobacter amalonaticus]POU67536.1 RidA family protein [Citrobacter amalonaticus]POV07141.1 RidA family protein [Citrobacter amalonaticus]
MPDNLICTNASVLGEPAGHYSHTCTAGGFVFISGQLPVTSSGENDPSTPFDEQVRRVLANLDACLESANTDRSSLVSIRIYITDIAQWPTFNQIYAQWLGDHKPARIVAGVDALHYGFAVEVEAVALARSIS